VNLIGDHTDYTGGLAMPMAIQLGTKVTFTGDPESRVVELTSTAETETARVPTNVPEDSFELAMLLPEWARHVAGVVAVMTPAVGGTGHVSSDLPVGVGLSSSASLGVALALAFGLGGSPVELARTCQRAEQLATGVLTGILDQIAIISAEAGHAMCLDCSTLSIRYVPVPPPEEVQIVAVPCGIVRSVASSAYDERRRQCEAAEREIGPLRTSSPWDVDAIRDPLTRRRARHVVSENARVRAFAGALEHADLRAAGFLMNDSHASLSMDFDVSVRELDELVSMLQETEGVFGARLTGAGFGGCAVVLARPGVVGRRLGDRPYWVLRPAGRAKIVSRDEARADQVPSKPLR
jgi:galactokinase